MIRALIFLVLGCALCGPASGHQPSTAYLDLRIDGRLVEGRLDVALGDAERLLGLDGDADGELTWGEVRRAEHAVQGLVDQAIRLQLDGAECTLDPLPIAIIDHPDGRAAAIPFRGRCAVAGETLDLQYSLLSGVDPEHRALVRVAFRGEQTAIAGMEQRRLRFQAGAPGGLDAFTTYFWQGVHHIGMGLDHLLFLSCLLLPAVVRYRNGAFEVSASGWRAFVDVAKVITAFTLAHALSLTAVTFEWLRLPVRMVEALVAATILHAALNNVLPLVRTERLWLVAFGFGLIHGAGYASVLSGLDLSSGSMLLALLGFNLGVEGAQIAIAAAFLPLAFLFRRRAWYRYGVASFGSLLIAGVAFLWLVERTFNVRF